MIICGGENEIFKHNKDNCNISLIYLFFGMASLVISLMISILIEYCNENYKFLEKNLLKRRFRYIIILEILIKLLIISLHFHENLQSTMYVFSHLLGKIVIFITFLRNYIII